MFRKLITSIGIALGFFMVYLAYEQKQTIISLEYNNWLWLSGVVVMLLSASAFSSKNKNKEYYEYEYPIQKEDFEN